MKDYLSIQKFEDVISLAFYIESEKPMEVGARLAEIDERAEMNGYNWDALITAYVEENVPELDGEFESDPEAGMYAAYLELSDEGEKLAYKLADVIETLVEDGYTVFDFVKSSGDDIDWD